MNKEENKYEKLKEKNEEKQIEQKPSNQQLFPEQQESHFINNQSQYTQNQQITQQHQQTSPSTQPQQLPPNLQPEFQEYQQQYPIQKLSTIPQTGILDKDMRVSGFTEKGKFSAFASRLREGAARDKTRHSRRRAANDFRSA